MTGSVRTRSDGEVEHDLSAEHLHPVISMLPSVPRALNGCTYAGNWFESHCEGFVG
jgi:hypothetical protein